MRRPEGVPELRLVFPHSLQKKEGPVHERHRLVRNRIATVVDRRKEDKKACEELEKLGYPYEVLMGARTDGKNLRPSLVLQKARCMLRVFRKVLPWYLTFSEERIIEEARKREKIKQTDQQEQGALVRYLEEHHIPKPSDDILRTFSPGRLLSFLRELERYEIEFEPQMWNWVKSPKNERKKWYETYKKQGVLDSRWKELGVSGDLFKQRYGPSSFRNYMTLLKQVGHPLSHYLPALAARVYTLRQFRHRLARKISRTPQQTKKEAAYLRRFQLAKSLHAFFPASQFRSSVFDLVDDIPDAAIRPLQASAERKNRDALVAYLQPFDIQRDRKRAVQICLERYDLSFAVIDQFTADVKTRDKTFQRLCVLERLQIPITVEALQGISPGNIHLSREEQEIFTFLIHQGVDPFIAQSLAMTGQTKDELKEKIAFYKSLPLTLAVHGKARALVSDVEDLLFDSVSVCRISGKKQLQARLTRDRLQADFQQDPTLYSVVRLYPNFSFKGSKLSC